MIGVAFKEWAPVCAALASGRQAVVLRKGGIAESGGRFTPDQPRFWLWPTAFHADPAALKPWAALLPAPPAPPSGDVELSHWAEVAAVRFATSLDVVLALDDLHSWGEATVRQRFAYRSPGLYVLTLRVRAVRVPWLVPDRPEYAGCKSWVPLAEALAEAPAEPALGDDAFAAIEAEVARRMGGV